MHEGQRAEGLAEGIVGVTALFLESVQITADVHAQQCCLRHIHIDVGTQVELLVVRGIVHQQALVLLQDAALLEVRGHNRVAQEVATTAHVEVATGGVGIVLGDFVHPVHVRIEVGVVARTGAVYLLLGEGQCRAVLGSQLVEQRHIVGRIQKLGQLCGLVDGVLHMEAYLRCAYLTALGGDDNHTVGTAHTIHGRGGSVFQHRERLNLSHVDVIEVALHTVNQNQRLVASREGRDTTNPEVRVVVSGLSRALNANHTAQLTSQVVR